MYIAGVEKCPRSTNVDVGEPSAQNISVKICKQGFHLLLCGCECYKKTDFRKLMYSPLVMVLMQSYCPDNQK